MYECTSCYEPANSYIKRIIVSDSSKNKSVRVPFPFSEGGMPLCQTCLELVRNYAYQHVAGGPSAETEFKVLLDLGFYKEGYDKCN